MRKKKLGLMVLTLGLIMNASTAFGWGMLGHRIVAGIAEEYLSKRARARIHEILGNESMAMAANWADFIKSDTNYKYLNNWHYVDFAPHLAYDQMVATLAADSGINAYNRINFLTAELMKADLPRDRQIMYLRLLIHIVGDVHQPLHVGRAETQGGNTVKLNWFSESSNLHRVWDEQLIEYQQLSYTEYIRAINFTTRDQVRVWQAEPLTQWLYQSYQLSESLHDELTGNNNIRLSYRYNFDHVAQLNEQLLRGGVHLAGLLNQIFG